MSETTAKPKVKNDRSIFMFMAPAAHLAPEVKKNFAQCAPGCRMLVPMSELPAEGKHKKNCDLCVVIGSQDDVDGGYKKGLGSCGAYVLWPTEDGLPDPAVVAEHAKKLSEGAPGSATKEEVGYVERKVRCENCEYGGQPKCQAYELLNKKVPEYFEEHRDIEPQACCNTQTPPDGDDDDLSVYASDDTWNEGSHSRAANGQFGSGSTTTGSHGGPHTVVHEKGDPRGKASESEARMLNYKQPNAPGPSKSNSTPASSQEGKKSISAEALGKKLKGMSTEKLNEALEHKDVDPKIKAYISREITSRHLGGDTSISSARAIAFDYASVRTTDKDGRMHVAVTNISKANVCPYLGSEIPDYEKLGLDPNRVYQLYRHPDEIAKAAHTFNNIPLLIKHTPVSADDPQLDQVVGTLGSEAEFVAPYLKNSLAVWTREGIDLIESERQKELSPGYRYRADMTPGHTPWGEPYDGVMRDMEGNHVCIVKEGRTGPDVFVGDSALPKIKEVSPMSKILSRKAAMAHGAMSVYLLPKLAKDAKIDLSPILAGVTAKNFKDKKLSIIAGVKEATKGKLANDASIEDVNALLDKLDGVETAEAIDEDMDEEDPAAIDADPTEGLRSFLKGIGATDEDVEKAVSYMKPKATDESPEEKAAREKKEAEAAAAGTATDSDKDKDMVDKKAMDAAVKLASDGAAKRAEDATMKRLNDIRVAERAVEPLIGKPAVALDSAEKIYEAALKAHDVKTEGVPHAAFPSMVDMLVKSKGAPRLAHTQHALDAASTSDRAAFEKANGIQPRRIRNLG
jgi:hypothetical protein